MGEVGFWQILFTAIFITIMVLWRPSPHFKKYAYYNQGPSGDHADEYGDADDEEAADFNAPETFADNIKRRRRDDTEETGDGAGDGATPKFAIDDEEEEEDVEDQFDYDRKPKTTLGDTINIEMTESAKVDWERGCTRLYWNVIRWS